eukprot:5537265-Pleurochrysis_carterae.AAC.1
MHVNDFDDDYLPLARIDEDMLLCVHTTAANASDVLPPAKNYKDINGRPDEEEWRVACIEDVKGKVANDTFSSSSAPRIPSSARPSGIHQQAHNDGALKRCKARWVLCGLLRLQLTTWSSFRQDLHRNC